MTTFATTLLLFIASNAVTAEDDAAIRQAVSFYASFDEKIAGDFGNGELAPSTRSDHPSQKGNYVIETGYPKRAFGIAKGKGVSGGALQGRDVLPRRGRLFFPAKGNLPYKSGGWSGAVSFWLNTNPNTLLKTRFCDPVQITERRAGDGGLWVDFPDIKPRDMRLGAFRALAVGEKSVPESDPSAPLITLKKVPFKEGDWHHVVMTWRNLDTGKPNAHVTLYVDGKRIGELTGREIAMKWNLDRTGIYFAVGYIGLLDELAIFDRPLTEPEIRRLQRQPGLLSGLKKKSLR